MPHYTCDLDLEITGQSVLAFFENINYESIKPVLEQHGLAEVDPGTWYPVQLVLDVMNDIVARGNAMSDFVAIGMKTAEIAPLSEEMQRMPFDQFMGVYSKFFASRHRGGDFGAIAVEKSSDTATVLRLVVPYPDDVMYGLIYGYARRLLPGNIAFTVYYDEYVEPHDLGGDETVIHVEWGD